MDAAQSLLLAEQILQSGDVGCRDARLLEATHSRGCAAERDTIHTQRFYHNFPRLAEEHRQTALCTARGAEVA